MSAPDPVVLDDDPHTRAKRSCAHCGAADVYCFAVTKHRLDFVIPWGREYRFVCPSCSRWFTTQSWLRAAIELVGYLTAALILAGFLIRAADSATAYVCLTAAIMLFAFGALRPLYLLRNRRRNPLASNGDPARSPRER